MGNLTNWVSSRASEQVATTEACMANHTDMSKYMNAEESVSM
jgi:hypothetical protein